MRLKAPLGRGVKLLLRLAVSLALLVALLHAIGWSNVVHTLAGADPGWAALGLLLAVLANTACAWRWRALVRWLRHEVAWPWAWVAYQRGVALNAVLPGATVGGDVWRAWALQRTWLDWPRASASVLLDRISGLWGLALLGGGCAVGALLADGTALRLTLAPGGRGATAAAVGVAVLVLAWLPRALLRWGAARTGGRHPWWGWWTMLAQHEPLRHWRQQLLASVGAQAVTVAALWAAALAVVAPLAWWWLAPAAVPIFVAAALPVGLGGWGTREAASAAVLAWLGVPAAQAVGMSLLFGAYALLQAPLGLLPLPRPPSGA